MATCVSIRPRKTVAKQYYTSIYPPSGVESLHLISLFMTKVQLPIIKHVIDTPLFIWNMGIHSLNFSFHIADQASVLNVKTTGFGL